MKTYIININKIAITFYVGKNSTENFEIIDNALENDMWFHLNDYPSCHVIASIPENIRDKKNIHKIIKQGALLCKINSNYASIKNLNIVFTRVKNVCKTDIAGTVITKEKKNIFI
jgi:predicted ribosome quality control (RQC) complex YloA/Tae2 family protein